MMRRTGLRLSARRSAAGSWVPRRRAKSG